MKRYWLLFPLCWLLWGIAECQVSFPYVTYVATAPTGTCSYNPQIPIVRSTGTAYTCNNGTWGAVSGGGSSGVSSFNTRTGAVTPISGDYSSFYCLLSGCTMTGSLVVPSMSTNGTTAGTLGLSSGTGTVTAPAGSGFLGPVSGGTPFYYKLPATWTAGLLYAPTPASGADGQNETTLAVASSANLQSVIGSGVYDASGAAAAAAAASVPLAGGTMTGALVLPSGTPTGTQAVNQAYLASTYLQKTGGAYIAVAGTPTITPTANTNLLGYTQGFYGWALNNGSLTTGQPDELGTSTATLFTTDTSNTAHNIAYDLPYNAVSSSTATAFSVWVKPNGYNFLDFRIHVVSGLSNGFTDNYINASTCAVTVTGSGYTVTATAGTGAASGWCNVQMTGSLGANYVIDEVMLATTANSGTLPYTANGTSGMYISHPSFSYSSTVPAFQLTTGPHRYSCVAYNSSGASSGASPWINSTSPLLGISDVNTVTCPTVTGASYCEYYRTGGLTQGALIYSGSVQIPCGTAVTDNFLVADGTTAPVGNATGATGGNLSAYAYAPDTRKTQTYVDEYTYMFQYTQRKRLLTIEPGAQGTITSIHLSKNAIEQQNDTLIISCGEPSGTVTNTLNVGTFLLSQGKPTGFSGNRISIGYGGNNNGVSNGGYFSATRETEIPFTNGCAVDLLNTSSGNDTAWATINYKIGSYYSSPLRHIWRSYNVQTLTALSSLAVANIYPATSYTGGGEMESVAVYYNIPSSSYSTLEANPVIYLDADLFTDNGTEDFFGTGFYGANNGTPGQQSDKWGYWTGSCSTTNTPYYCTNTSGANTGGLWAAINNYDWFGYRFFGNNPAESATFNSSVQVTIANGQAGESTPAAINYYSLVTLWTAQ
jgi:hypothetical protein